MTVPFWQLPGQRAEALVCVCGRRWQKARKKFFGLICVSPGACDARKVGSSGESVAGDTYQAAASGDLDLDENWQLLRAAR